MCNDERTIMTKRENVISLTINDNRCRSLDLSFINGLKSLQEFFLHNRAMHNDLAPFDGLTSLRRLILDLYGVPDYCVVDINCN